MFFKIIRLVFSVATISLLVACGGSSGGDSKSSLTTTEKISSRDVVAINYHYSSEICRSSEFHNYMKNALSFGKDFIFSVENNSVTCATYGKVNNGNECHQQNSKNNYSTSCVVGMNIVNNSNKISKISKGSTAKNATEMIIGY